MDEVLNGFFDLIFQAGWPWFSILTRTGVFKGEENHSKFPADLVRPNELSFMIHHYIFFLLMVLMKEWSYGLKIGCRHGGGGD